MDELDEDCEDGRVGQAVLAVGEQELVDVGNEFAADHGVNFVLDSR